MKRPLKGGTTIADAAVNMIAGGAAIAAPQPIAERNVGILYSDLSRSAQVFRYNQPLGVRNEKN